MKSEDKSNISDHLNEYNFKKLKIKFLEKDEIKIFSTLCQDGIFSVDEIIYNKKIAKQILISESIKLATKFGGQDSYKFINAFLDNFETIEK